MTPVIQDPDFTLWQGDVTDVLPRLEAGSVDCVVTSPPYWGLRDYGVDGQLGLEPTPELFVERMVAVFREVRRVLADHGTCWVNIGDSYATGGMGGASGQSTLQGGGGRYRDGSKLLALHEGGQGKSRPAPPGLKPKDLCGIPWRLAFALQADGWWLRADVIWAKPNPMPESVTDRPTKAHEYVFLLTKAPRYWYDQEAVREPHADTEWTRRGAADGVSVHAGQVGGNRDVGGNRPTMAVPERLYNPAGRNIRSVWDIATEPYPDAHFATFPQALVERCLKAGCPERVCVTCGKASERIVESEIVGTARNERGHYAKHDGADGTNHYLSKTSVHGTRVGTTLGWSDCGHNNWRTGIVLDPFLGSGTTALVARRLGRHAVGIELNPDYCRQIAKRLQQLSLLAEATA